MEISQKREEIAACIVNLKKGLKRIRRDDIDAAIQLLLMYDQDLKKIAKIPARPIEQQTKITHDVDYSASPAKSIKVIAVNDENGSWAYPLLGTMENTILNITKGEVKPLAKVQIDPWMKEHRHNEIAFTSFYAAVVSGKLITKHEDILTVGCLAHLKGQTEAYPVRKVSEDKVWLDNGWLKSLIPHKIGNVVPIKQTEVKYFIIEKWEQ